MKSYRYDFGDGDQKEINAGPDGSAVLAWTPEVGGYYTITVYSVDRWGHQSQPTQESFSVIDTHPGVYVHAYDPQVGDPVAVSAWSDLPNAVAIVYSFDGGPEQTLDGRSVDFEVVPTRAGDNAIKVWARLDDGTLTPPTTSVVHVNSAPRITSQGPFGEDAVMGRPVTITLTAAQDGATTFRYSIGNSYDGEEDPVRTVPVGADGTATISFDVPEGWGGVWGDVLVIATSLTADGTESDTKSVSLNLRNPRVEVNNPWPAGLRRSDGRRRGARSVRILRVRPQRGDHQVPVARQRRSGAGVGPRPGGVGEHGLVHAGPGRRQHALRPARVHRRVAVSARDDPVRGRYPAADHVGRLSARRAERRRRRGRRLPVQRRHAGNRVVRLPVRRRQQR
nr:hypothetical protein GCM10020092_004500 [Actinoplanes digitatis]